MNSKDIKLSPEFRTQTIKAITSIVFFIISYIVILAIAVGLTALCVYIGLIMITGHPSFITLVLGIGIASMGFLILFFVLKFMFSSHKADRSHWHEISASDEPELFRLIEEIVKEVGTTFPKRVYLASDVNAAVFYDSSFWSMFFPVKKNLLIGMGLVNTVTKTELKAILSHEFGHFSQRSMKVGSYVYNVNQIIFNLLFDNESYGKMMQSWAGVSGYFSIFVAIAAKIIEMIQGILRELYGVVNKPYMGLSREMEFHADEIAARVTGYEPLKSSLLRMNLSNYALNSVMNFYQEKMTECVKSQNLYIEQLFVLRLEAERNKIPVTGNLPQVAVEDLSRFNKSKLVIKDQWASHPATEERIASLERKGFSAIKPDLSPANEIFKNITQTQETLTRLVFRDVAYKGEVKYLQPATFQEGYLKLFNEKTFPELYNGYYDDKNPLDFGINSMEPPDKIINPEDLFSAHKLDLVYTSIALKNDIEVLKQIAEEKIGVKSFDYDGRKLKRSESHLLIKQLITEMNELNEKIKLNDQHIFWFFRKLERGTGEVEQLSGMYSDFFGFDKVYEGRMEVYTKLINALRFVNFNTPFEQINENFRAVKPIENELKENINYMLGFSGCQPVITDEVKGSLETYLKKERVYFEQNAYREENLKILFTALENYALLLARTYFQLKKNLLLYQAGLLKA